MGQVRGYMGLPSGYILYSRSYICGYAHNYMGFVTVFVLAEYIKL